MYGSHIPFLRIIIPAASGIVLSHFIEINPAITASCCAVSLCTGWLLRKRPLSGLYIWTAVFLFFLSASLINKPESVLSADGRFVAAARITDVPYVRGCWQNTTAVVEHYRPEDGGRWRKAEERIQLSADTSYSLSLGELIAFRGWFNPIGSSSGYYGELMKLRGIHGRMYLTEGNLIARSAVKSRTPRYLAGKLHSAAAERIGRLELDGERMPVVAAMTAGDKRAIGSKLRGDYNSVGAAHLLAVSGLHVGIVFVLINLLLYILPAFPRGHAVKNAAAIIAIWLYAAAAGLSPSVIRAALMFSFAQAALASSSYRNTLNIVLGSAVAMLAVNPNWAGDPSFLLSYVAVLSIVVFFKPLLRLFKTRFKAANALLSVVIVGLTATLGTAPLVAYWFGNFPLAGLIINPIVIFTAHVTVFAGVLWMIVPFDFLNPLFSRILSFSAGLQNDVVAWSASGEWSSVKIDLPLWVVWVIYAVFATLAVTVYGFERKRNSELSDVKV